MTALVEVAEHEAAHVVVGVMLGLPLKVATIKEEQYRCSIILGYAWFGGGHNKLAHGIVACAGMVFERRPGGKPSTASGDRKNALKYLRTHAQVKTGCKIAAEILSRRQGVLKRVARELCDRDLRPAELAELILEQP